MMTCGRRSLAI